MVCLFDRFLTEDLWTPATPPVLKFFIHPRIEVIVYEDSPCYMAMFVVDSFPTLKENMIENLNEYYHRTSIDRNFHAVLIEMHAV